MKNKIANLEKEIADLNKQIDAYVPKTDPRQTYDWGRHNLINRRRSLRRELTHLLRIGQPQYKIRDIETGEYSSGIVSSYRDKRVSFNKKGKVWTTESALKKHLMKCITDGGGIPENWEVVKLVEEPVKEMNEWIDSEMLVALLKHKKEK